jgi:hypothetical protein
MVVKYLLKVAAVCLFCAPAYSVETEELELARKAIEEHGQQHKQCLQIQSIEHRRACLYELRYNRWAHIYAQKIVARHDKPLLVIH